MNLTAEEKLMYAVMKAIYEKFRFTGDVTKPPFEEVYRTVRAYVKDVLPREKKRELER